MAGAKVIQRNRHAQLSQFGQYLLSLIGVDHGLRLRDFQLQPLRRHLMALQTASDLIHQIHLPQLIGRQIDCHAQRTSGLEPGRDLLAGRIQHIVAQRHDLTRSLGHRNKTHRADIAQHRVMPAQQSFHAHHPACAHFDLRLVVQLQAAIAESHAQTLSKLHSLGHLLTHAGLEEDGIAPALRLGGIHGHVGKAHEIVTVLCILRVQRNADAGAKVQRQTVVLEGNRQGRQYLIGPEAKPAYVLAHQQHHEFIAAQARQNAFAAQLGLEPAGDLSEQLVACGMAVAVIDSLEVIEIELQQRQHVAAGLRDLELFLQILTKLPAVVQPCERVARGLELQALLHLVEFRHIAHKGHGQAVALIAKVTQGNIHRHRTALLALQPEGATQPHGPARWPRKIAAQVVAMRGVQVARQQDIEWLRLQLLALIPRNRQHGRIGSDDVAITADEQDAIGCGIQCLALTRCEQGSHIHLPR